MNRRDVLRAVAALGAATGPLFAFAQPSMKFARIGFLGIGSAADTAGRVNGLRAGLRDLGYAEGKNIAIEFRWAEGNYGRLAGLAAELVRLKVDVLVALGSAGARAAKQATTTIPIVMIAGDIVAENLVTSLARPGGNVTGLTFFARELSAKRLELLKDAMPRITRAAILVNPDNRSTRLFLEAIQTTARTLNMELLRFEARGPAEFRDAFAGMVRQQVDAVVVLEDAMLNVNPERIADLAVEHRLALVGNSDFAVAGGLIGYGVNFFELLRRAATFVDKILKGVSPGDLPVEQPTRFELVINLKTSRALGLAVSPSLLLRAETVIE